MLPEFEWMANGWNEADSIIINPHKTLYVPLDFSVLYVRDLERLRRVFTLVPEYLRGDTVEAEKNYMDYGIQLGRRFRAMKAWVTWRAFGREGMVAFAGYPLLIEDRVLGVLAMFARRPLAEDTLQTLGAIADSLALGIERKRGQTALAESEARFRQLADNSADVVWRFFSEPYPHFDYVSPSIENILGYAAEVFLADFNRLLEILDHHGRELIRRSLDGEPMPKRYDLRYRCADGSTVIFETQTTELPGGLQGVSRDVTVRNAAEARVQHLASHDDLTGFWKDRSSNR